MENVRGTEGYAEFATAILDAEPSIPFVADHEPVLHLLPTSPSDVADIGAGTGRAAAWFAAAGHRVVAVEPVDALRVPAMTRHPSPAIEWLDDALPLLSALTARQQSFDVVLLTAVWMHLDEDARRVAMPVIAALLKRDGVMIMSLRHGPAPPLRRMYDVSAQETIGLAQVNGLACVFESTAPSVQQVNRDAGVTWTRLAFRRA